MVGEAESKAKLHTELAGEADHKAHSSLSCAWLLCPHSLARTPIYYVMNFSLSWLLVLTHTIIMGLFRTLSDFAMQFEKGLHLLLPIKLLLVHGIVSVLQELWRWRL